MLCTVEKQRGCSSCAVGFGIAERRKVVQWNIYWATTTSLNWSLKQLLLFFLFALNCHCSLWTISLLHCISSMSFAGDFSHAWVIVRHFIHDLTGTRFDGNRAASKRGVTLPFPYLMCHHKLHLVTKICELNFDYISLSPRFTFRIGAVDIGCQ